MEKSSLGAWASRKVQTVADRVKAKLAVARVTPHGVAHPFPVGDKNDYKSKHTRDEIDRAIKKAPVVDVPLHRLVAIQKSVAPDRVMHYVDDPNDVPESSWGGPVDHPIVIQHGGTLYLHDGHHRSAAAELSGKTTIKARLVNLDAG